MPLVTMKQLLVRARENVYGVGAFQFWSFDSAQAVIWAAEEQKMPVILQAGPLEIEYAGLKNIYQIAKAVTEGPGVEAALHLDHGETFEDARQAIEAGFTSVMIDASHLSFKENVELTKRVVKAARPHGVTVEAELGRLAGIEGNLSVSEEEAAQTDPDEAKRFVEETGIDALAVAIGTAHGFYKYAPRINIERLKLIAGKVDIPLVLHGGSKTPDEKVKEAIANGIAKVNICTEFVAAFGKAYVDTQNTPGFKYGVPSLFIPSRTAGKKLAASKIKLFSLRG